MSGRFYSGLMAAIVGLGMALVVSPLFPRKRKDRS